MDFYSNQQIYEKSFIPLIKKEKNSCQKLNYEK